MPGPDEEVPEGVTLDPIGDEPEDVQLDPIEMFPDGPRVVEIPVPSVPGRREPLVTPDTPITELPEIEIRPMPDEFPYRRLTRALAGVPRVGPAIAAIGEAASTSVPGLGREVDIPIEALAGPAPALIGGAARALGLVGEGSGMTPVSLRAGALGAADVASSFRADEAEAALRSGGIGDALSALRGEPSPELASVRRQAGSIREEAPVAYGLGQAAAIAPQVAVPGLGGLAAGRGFGLAGRLGASALEAGAVTAGQAGGESTAPAGSPEWRRDVLRGEQEGALYGLGGGVLGEIAAPIGRIAARGMARDRLGAAGLGGGRTLAGRSSMEAVEERFPRSARRPGGIEGMAQTMRETGLGGLQTRAQLEERAPGVARAAGERIGAIIDRADASGVRQPIDVIGRELEESWAELATSTLPEQRALAQRMDDWVDELRSQYPAGMSASEMRTVIRDQLDRQLSRIYSARRTGEQIAGTPSEMLSEQRRGMQRALDALVERAAAEGAPQSAAGYRQAGGSTDEAAEIGARELDDYRRARQEVMAAREVEEHAGRAEGRGRTGGLLGMGDVVALGIGGGSGFGAGFVQPDPERSAAQQTASGGGGGIVGSLAALMAWRLARSRGLAAKATFRESVARIGTTPRQTLEVAGRMARQGPVGEAAAHYLLGRTSPEYQAEIEGQEEP